MPNGKRDPASIAFDDAAQHLLERAYRNRGEWISVRIKDPTPREQMRYGLTPDTPDPVASGTAKTEWARHLVRAVYHHNMRRPRRGPLRFQVGRHIPASPQFDPANPEAGGFPPARQFRIKIDRGGASARAALQRLPDRQRWMLDDASGHKVAGPAHASNQS